MPQINALLGPQKTVHKDKIRAELRYLAVQEYSIACSILTEAFAANAGEEHMAYLKGRIESLASLFDDIAPNWRKDDWLEKALEGAGRGVIYSIPEEPHDFETYQKYLLPHLLPQSRLTEEREELMRDIERIKAEAARLGVSLT